MINAFFPLVALFQAGLFSFHAQVIEKKPFIDGVYPKIIVRRNLVYSTPPKSGLKSSFYKFDLYSPATDPVLKRPLIIMMHGGGFRLGSKNSNSTPVFSRSFAQRGYVCASINYRLSKKRPLSKFEDLASGCFDAIRDLQQAISYFKTNADKYQVDTNNIILAGNSAGGMIALQAVFSPPVALAGKFNNKKPGIIPAGPFVENIRAVVNCWGGIYDSTWLENAHVPVISIHGSKDRVVPLNFTDSTVFGSAVIHRQLDNLGVPNQIKVYDGIGHELARHFNPFWNGSKSRKRCREAAVIISGFLAGQISANTSSRASPARKL